MLKGAGAAGDKPGSVTQPGLGGVLGNLGGEGATGGVGGLLGGGLGELFERFKQSGQAEVAQSWVNDGPNKEIAPPQLKQAIGADEIRALCEHGVIKGTSIRFLPVASSPSSPTANAQGLATPEASL